MQCFYFSCTCYVGENVYKNGLVTLMCITFMVLSDFFMDYLDLCLSLVH